VLIVNFTPLSRSASTCELLERRDGAVASSTTADLEDDPALGRSPSPSLLRGRCRADPVRSSTSTTRARPPRRSRGLAVWTCLEPRRARAQDRPVAPHLVGGARSLLLVRRVDPDDARAPYLMPSRRDLVEPQSNSRARQKMTRRGRRTPGRRGPCAQARGRWVRSRSPRRSLHRVEAQLDQRDREALLLPDHLVDAPLHRLRRGLDLLRPLVEHGEVLVERFHLPRARRDELLNSSSRHRELEALIVAIDHRRGATRHHVDVEVDSSRRAAEAAFGSRAAGRSDASSEACGCGSSCGLRLVGAAFAGRRGRAALRALHLAAGHREGMPQPGRTPPALSRSIPPARAPRRRARPGLQQVRHPSSGARRPWAAPLRT